MPTPCRPPETEYPPPPNLPPAWSTVITTSTVDLCSVGCSSTGMPRPSSLTRTAPSAWMVTSMRLAYPARASSTELSTTSYTRWCRPRSVVEPIYIPGRLRTASSPSRTVMSDAPYSWGCSVATGAKLLGLNWYEPCCLSRVPHPLGCGRHIFFNILPKYSPSRRLFRRFQGVFSALRPSKVPRGLHTPNPSEGIHTIGPRRLSGKNACQLILCRPATHRYRAPRDHPALVSAHASSIARYWGQKYALS